MEVHLHFSLSWIHVGNVSIRGSAFYAGDLRGSERLAEVFVGLHSPAEIITRTQALNVFFSVVIKTPTNLVFAVDIVRSIPLFYIVRGDQLYLSDNPRWILQEAKLRGWDRCSQLEFLLTGYVTGPHTLQEEILQVQAGELVCVDLKAGTVHSERWYRCLYISREEDDLDTLMERLATVTRESISRLISFAAGRLIVIPLSGGLDSRLIAMHLKLSNYQPVYAFSYGTPGNREAEISRSVAQQLGIEWKFVPYSHERWNAWYRSSEWRAYMCVADGLVSVALIQDWPAVWELLLIGDVPDHTVFVPGHTGNFVSGGHIPLELLQSHSEYVEDFIEAVWKHHYRLFPIEEAAERCGVPISMAENCVRNRIQSISGYVEITSVEDAVGAYEYWEWQERQAKFIVNSVRVYEFWRQVWWLPWWDAEFIDFWQRVPLRYRIGRQLWVKYVEQVQRKVNLVAPLPSCTLPSHTLVRRFKSFIKGLLYAYYALLVYRKWTRRWILLREFYHHPLAWYGITEPERFIELLRNGGNINTIIAVDQLELLEKEVGLK